MTDSDWKLRPDETTQKMLLSTTSRLVGEYQRPGVVVTHAWPSVYDSASNMRMLSTPISRSGYIVAFATPAFEPRSGVVVPDYTRFGEEICAYSSVLFGKRFDCHGAVESTGMYRIPDFTAFSSVSNPSLPFNSHSVRKGNSTPLNLDQLGSLEKLLRIESIDSRLRQKLTAACKFYMQALQQAETNVEVAYLHLISAGGILSSFSKYRKESILDRQLLSDLDDIRQHLEKGDKIANRLGKRLTAIKKTFVKSLYRLLDDEFFATSESHLEYGVFGREDMEKRIGAAYDLRSRYVHTGVAFGRWVEPRRELGDVQLGRPVVDNAQFSKLLALAPTFLGLERLIRHSILQFMKLRGLHKEIRSE